MKADMKPKPEKDTSDRLTAAYEAATADDKARVHQLVRRAVGATRATDIMEFTPGMSAILFHDHNSQNRKWQWSTTLNYERMMRSGDWDFINNGLGFGNNGALIDGQHRLAAVALSGQPITFTVTFGMDLKAVETIDTNRRREPATAVHILRHKEMPEAVAKTQIITKADDFLAKATGRAPTLHGDSRLIGLALQENEAHIDEAIRIAKEASASIAKPTLKTREAQVLAYSLLKSGWPAVTVAEHLHHYQTGQDVGENAPFFVAAKILERESRGERYSFTAKMALAVKVFQLAEEGIKAVKPSSLRDVMKPKNFPNPAYPGSDVAA